MNSDDTSFLIWPFFPLKILIAVLSITLFFLLLSIFQLVCIIFQSVPFFGDNFSSEFPGIYIQSKRLPTNTPTPGISFHFNFRYFP